MITNLPPEIPLPDVWRFLGYPPGRFPPARVQADLDRLVREAGGLLAPRGVHARFSASEAGAVSLPRMDVEDATLSFVLALATIGPGLETRATAAIEGGDATAALLLDAIGSAAVEAAADALGRVLDHAGPAPAPPPCRISPGYGDWPLSAQEAVFSRLPHREIGVQLLPSMLMVPRKSVTFAVWFDAAGRPVRARADCARCARNACPQREPKSAAETS